MQHASDNWFVVIFEGTLVIIILGKILVSMRGKLPFIRRIPGLNAIEEAIGRATEMGKPILMIPGILGLDIVSLQALNVFSYVTRIAARFATPIRLCVCDAPLYTISQEVIQDAYHAEGRPELYDPDSVKFLSDQQFAFAASVAGLIQREQVAATFFLGAFYAESLIFAEMANSVGAIQVAGTVMTTQTPFFIAACDYVIIGDEFYAASAYLSREPVATGSLVGQDYSKLLLAAIILLGSLIYTALAFTGTGNEPLIYKLFQDGGWNVLMKALHHL
jgi:hypothetical protein